MGIYIKGMEMPKEDGAISIYKIGEKFFAQRARADKLCPLIEVPPHGDLIERDKLREKEFIHAGDAYAVIMSRDIRNAPTIIPAEEG